MPFGVIDITWSHDPSLSVHTFGASDLLKVLDILAFGLLLREGAYLKFVTGATGGARVNFFWPV